MITTDNQDMLRTWLARRLGCRVHFDMQCIGHTTDDVLDFVVGYENYNQASIWIHMASDGSSMASKEMLWAAFDYPFNTCEVNVLLAQACASNKTAMQAIERLGFKLKLEIDGAHPDGALAIFAMTREECRFLNLTRSHHGQQRQSTASA